MFKTLALTASLLASTAMADGHRETKAPGVPVPSDYTWPMPVDEAYFQIAIITVVQDGVEKDILMYRGAISETTTETISYFLDKHPHIDEVSLYSPGGVAYESFELGILFSTRNIKTTVSPNAICLSSCAFAFIGGVDHRIDGILGFHHAYLQLAPETKAEVGMVTDSYIAGQHIGAQMQTWLMGNGYHSLLGLVMTRVTSPTTFMVFLHEDELNRYKVRNDVGTTDINVFLEETEFTAAESFGLKIFGDKEFADYMAASETRAMPERGRSIVAFELVFPFNVAKTVEIPKE